MVSIHHPFHLHCPCSTVLLPQLIKEISALRANPKIYYCVYLTRAHYLSLTSDRSQSASYNTISLTSILILSSYLRLQLHSAPFLSGLLAICYPAHCDNDTFRIQRSCTAHRKALSFITVGIQPFGHYPSWRNTPCRLPATAHTIYSRIRSTYSGRLDHMQLRGARCGVVSGPLST